MNKPRIFIGSSVEGLNIAYAVQQNLLHDAEATVWSQGSFKLSETSIESLTKATEDNDFAVFVFSPDDVVHMRDSSEPAVRDNVLFEFGLFIGKLGRKRVFFTLPMGDNLHLPTDLVGITPGHYQKDRSDKNLEAATASFCNKIRNEIRELGPVAGRTEALPGGEAESVVHSEKRIWMLDFFEGKYEPALETLKTEVSTGVEKEDLYRAAYILMCEFKIRGNGDLSPFDDFVAANGKDATAAVSAASALRLIRQYEKAMNILVAARSKFGSNANIVTAIAHCHTEVSDDATAISELTSFGVNESPAVALQLSYLLEKQERIKEALEVIQRCHEKNSSDETLRFRYARLAQDRNQHEIALNLLSTLRYDNPENSEYWGYLGNSCYHLDMFDTAMHCYRQAERLTTSGNASWILANIGNILAGRGLPSESIVYLKKALAIDSDSEYSHERIATSLKLKAAEAKRFEKMSENGGAKIRAQALVLALKAFSIPPSEPPEVEILLAP